MSIGIDAEQNQALPEGILEMIGSREEISSLPASRLRVYWDRLLFSAKESLYKAWFPLMGTYLDFRDARLKIDPDTGSFQVRITPATGTPALKDSSFQGRFVARDEYLLAAVIIPALTPHKHLGEPGPDPLC